MKFRFTLFAFMSLVVRAGAQQDNRIKPGIDAVPPLMELAPFALIATGLATIVTAIGLFAVLLRARRLGVPSWYYASCVLPALCGIGFSFLAMISRGLLLGQFAFPRVETHLAYLAVPAYSCLISSAAIVIGLALQAWHTFIQRSVEQSRPANLPPPAAPGAS